MLDHYWMAIMGELQSQWNCIRHPTLGFQALTVRSGLLDAMSRMLLWRVPLTIAEGILAFWSLGRLYRSLADPSSSLWRSIAVSLPPEFSWADVEALLRQWPPFPELSRALPWIVLAAPIYVLSLWLHDAVWDHGCLWLLKGAQKEHGFRKTMQADAEALTVGSLGVLVGLLAYLPSAGIFFTPALGAVGLYFWFLRGFALAAFHGCPVWKGLSATVLHGALMLCGTLLILFLFGLLLSIGLR